MQRLAGFLGDLLVGFLEHRRRGDGLFVAPFGFQLVDGKLIGVNDLDDAKGQSGVVLREPHRFRKGCFGRSRSVVGDHNIVVQHGASSLAKVARYAQYTSVVRANAAGIGSARHAKGASGPYAEAGETNS